MGLGGGLGSLWSCASSDTTCMVLYCTSHPQGTGIFRPRQRLVNPGSSLLILAGAEDNRP